MHACMQYHSSKPRAMQLCVCPTKRIIKGPNAVFCGPDITQMKIAEAL